MIFIATRKGLTISEVAEILGLSYSTVWRMTKDGRLPRINIGTRAVRIPKKAVDEILDASEAETLIHHFSVKDFLG